VKEDNPEKTHTEHMKIIGNMWKKTKVEAVACASESESKSTTNSCSKDSKDSTEKVRLRQALRLGRYAQLEAMASWRSYQPR
jgi:hypothetical protein